ncbi:hypothetical protein ISR11_0582 [Streptococcus pyogenes]|nr:hypothetical protein SPYALAB49_000541 [Streptococcus pyogenes Alab49]AMY97060.1 Hypothetical protein AUQ45_0498 [Streptococcus pyogenes]ESA58177.1 hypothetical protein HMPREF1239_0170 [Streptococcus pyogenes GA03805]KGE55606.1 hypothetical protein SPYAA472_0506 [Streptococcus pyogenes AA472]KGE56704.1 hypothetical protein SPYAA216_0554 [Streptococcus pyogenes AA216]CCG26860.1 hypothetical protein [Streptococcus pyogenes NS88.2]
MKLIASLLCLISLTKSSKKEKVKSFSFLDDLTLTMRE